MSTDIARIIIDQSWSERGNMETAKLEELETKLKEITNMFTDEEIESMTVEQRAKITTLVAQLEARIEALKEL